MNENRVISVIVPVYNVEKYLDKCVDSIVNQTYKNLEIILVDDGSPDNCPKMCDAWVEKDSRIKVIHKENGGVSSARNAGLKASCGEYIGFVDSDDFIQPDMFEQLLGAYDKESIELSACALFYNIESVRPDNDFVCSNEDTYKMLFDRKAYPYFEGYIWNKLYVAEIIKNNNIQFSTDIKRCEDTLFNFEYFKYVNKTYIVNKCCYNYIINDASCTSINDINDYVKILDLTDYFYDSCNYQSVKEIIFAWGISYWIGTVNLSFKNTVKCDSVDKIRKMIKQNIRRIIKSKLISKANKVQLVLICYFYKAYCIYLKQKKH